MPEAEARTIVVGGAMTANGHAHLTYTVTITGLNPAQLTSNHKVVIKVPEFTSNSVDGFSQSISGFGITFNREPSIESGRQWDEYNNPYYTYEWSLAGYTQNSMIINIITDFDYTTTGSPTPESFTDPYPVVSPGQAQFLGSSIMAQSSNAEIVSRAQSLVAGATTEAAAVENVMDFIKEQIADEQNSQYDAVGTHQALKGTCTNRANLAIALLRAAGIPARFVSGVVGGQSYTVTFLTPEGQGTMESGWGPAAVTHTWIEVYYPQKGAWVGYDPYLNFGFVDQRHVKAGIAVDSEILEKDTSGLGYPVYTRLNDGAIVPQRPAINIDISVASEQGSYPFRSLKEAPGGDNPKMYVLGRDMVNAPTPTPSPTPVPTVTPTPSPAPNATITPTPLPGASVTPTPAPSPDSTPAPPDPGLPDGAGNGTFPVIFEIVDAATGKALTGATATFDGQPVPADGPGAFSTLAKNGTHALIVGAPGYGDVSATITVAGGNVTQTVRLVAATGDRDGVLMPVILCCGTMIAAAGLVTIIVWYRYRHGRRP